MKVTLTKEEKEEKIKFLKKILKKADNKVYGVVKHVSSSGMSRDIDFFIFTYEDKKIKKYWISYILAGLLNYPFNDNRESLKVSGCGMDMIFSVVYNLGSVLFPNGDGKTITGRNGSKKPETDGGYLLTAEKL